MAISMAVIISGCGGSGVGLSFSSNDFLNYLPSIAKSYELKIEEKEKEIHNNTSLENAFKLEKELDLLKEEWVTKIKESSTSNPITKPLPPKTWRGRIIKPAEAKAPVLIKFRLELSDILFFLTFFIFY